MSTNIVKKTNGYYSIETTRYNAGQRGMRGQIVIADSFQWMTIDLSKEEIIDMCAKIIESMNELG